MKKITKEEMEKFRNYLNTPRKFEDMQLAPNGLKLVPCESNAKFEKDALNIVMAKAQGEEVKLITLDEEPQEDVFSSKNLDVLYGHAKIPKDRIIRSYKNLYEFLQKSDSYINNQGKIERNNFFKDYELYCYQNQLNYNEYSKEDMYEYVREFYYDKFGQEFANIKEFYDSLKSNKKSWSQRNGE